MSKKSTSVRLKWPGGVHRFDLGVGQWVEGDRDRGMHDHLRGVLGRLIGGTWGVLDVAQTITCALTYGGSIEPTPLNEYDLLNRNLAASYARACATVGGAPEPNLGPATPPQSNAWGPSEALVRKHVLSKPLGQSVALAQLILMAAITGIPAALADQEHDVGYYTKILAET